MRLAIRQLIYLKLPTVNITNQGYNTFLLQFHSIELNQSSFHVKCHILLHIYFLPTTCLYLHNLIYNISVLGAIFHFPVENAEKIQWKHNWKRQYRMNKFYITFDAYSGGKSQRFSQSGGKYLKLSHNFGVYFMWKHYS